MKLSEQELRWLKRWEKNERLWLPVGRWIFVLFGGLNTVGGILISHLMMSLRDIPNVGAFVLFPLFFFAKAGFWFGYAIANWRGDIKLRLLLRLIREHEDKDT
jgi:hypothetical protein